MKYIVVNSYALPPATKRVELINFSGPKRGFGRRDDADCKQRGTKWSADGDESPIAACLNESRPPYLIFLVIRNICLSGLSRISDHGRQIWHYIWSLHFKIHYINVKKIVKLSFWILTFSLLQ